MDRKLPEVRECAGDILEKESRNLITLNQDQTLVTKGLYDIKVLCGTISIYGAYFKSDENACHRVYALSTDPLPTIECVSENAKFQVVTAPSSIKRLGQFCVSFRSSRNNSGHLENVGASADNIRGRHVACVSKTRTLRRLSLNQGQFYSNSNALGEDQYQRLIYPALWKEVIKKLCDPNNDALKPSSDTERGMKAPLILLSGHEQSGKSTFCRFLMNHLLTSSLYKATNARSSNGRERNAAVFLLDLDTNSPEFTPCGQITLIECHSTILGPEYTHPITLSQCKEGTRVVRTHFFGSQNISDRPNEFCACVRDLLETYQGNLVGNPLIIVAPGYLSHDLRRSSAPTKDLITILSPTAIVHLRGRRSVEADECVRRWSFESDTPLHSIRSQVSFEKHVPRREVRDLCLYSYFHVDRWNSRCDARWTSNAVALRTNVSWRYSGDDADILGILYCEHPAPSEQGVTIVLDGCLVWAVFIEDGALANELASKVIRTQIEDIPQIMEPNHLVSNLPDPRKSHLIGLARLNDIDVDENELDLCLPIPQNTLSQIRTRSPGSPPRVLLIKDGSEVPDWLYTEQAARKSCQDPRVNEDASVDVVAVSADHDAGTYGSSSEEEPYLQTRKADEPLPRRWKPQRRFGRVKMTED